VGVVENVRQWGAKEKPLPEIYWTLDRAWDRTIFLFVHSPQPPEQLTPLLRQQLASLNRNLPMSKIRSLRHLVLDATQGDRSVSEILVFFMASALGLLAVGLYGTLSYCMLQRRREIGIRIAVGAMPSSILRLVFRQSFAWVAIGMVAGLVSALALASVLRSLVWGVDPLGWGYLTISGIVIVLAAGFSCVAPAIRAMRVDPIAALKAE
jgi:putative ABC transport system permease protein